MVATGSKDFGGEICLRLSVADGAVGSVNISSTRPESASRVFVGRTPEETVAMLGLLFSLCGRAQTAASLLAVENALGLQAPPELATARDILRQAEMLSQSAMRLCLDWPRLLGKKEMPDIVKQCLGAESQLESHLFGGADWKKPGGIEMTPNVDGAVSVIRGLQKDTAALLDDESLAATLRNALSETNLQTFGTIAATEILEDGALRRQRNAPRVRKACDAHGLGLLARLEARFADFAALPATMLKAIDNLGPAEPIGSQPDTGGRGKSQVETVRGLLTHRVEVENGLISDYEISAPTDVNFSPDGPATQGLIGVDATDEEALARAAELHIMAIDPCVNCSLEIDHA